MSDHSTDLSIFSEQEEHQPRVSGFALEVLPVQAFAKVLSFLDLNDKFSLASFESIRLRVAFALRQQHSDLVVSNTLPSKENHWWISNDLISFKRDIISGFNFLNYYSMFGSDRFGCLKRIRFQFDLHIGDLIHMQAFFSNQLEQLEIEFLVFNNQPVKVTLNNLRVLKIKNIRNAESKFLAIESPFLSHVYFGKHLV